MSETTGAPELTGKMFLFEQPELMNKEQHGDLGVANAEKDYTFCSKVRAIPLTVTEIPAAMKDYPVIFASIEQPLPLAVVGLIDDVNLFVDDTGRWEENCYIPGYVRRYPFGLANETGGDRMAIVIDRAYRGLSPDGEIKLFDNGEPSQLTQNAIEFCKAFEQERQMTEQFVKQIQQYGVIQGLTAQFTPQGETQPKPFADYCGIDENKLGELSDTQFLELRGTGALPILYAMLMSMGNWRLILQRRAKRYGFSETDITTPAPGTTVN